MQSSPFFCATSQSSGMSVYFQNSASFCWRMITSNQPVVSRVQSGVAARTSRTVSYHVR